MGNKVYSHIDIDCDKEIDCRNCDDAKYCENKIKKNAHKQKASDTMRNGNEQALAFIGHGRRMR